MWLAVGGEVQAAHTHTNTCSLMGCWDLEEAFYLIGTGAWAGNKPLDINGTVTNNYNKIDKQPFLSQLDILFFFLYQFFISVAFNQAGGMKSFVPKQ